MVYKFDLIDEADNIISVQYREYINFLLALDETNKTVGLFRAESLGGTATKYIVPALNYSIDVYSKNEKNYCNIYMTNENSPLYYSTEVVQFVGKNIVISNVGIFAIGENNVLTAIDEDSSSYSEEFEKDGKLYRVEFKAEEKAYYIYLVTIDESQVRTETLIIAIQYVVGKEEMSIFVISFENRTITRYSVGSNNVSFWEIIENTLK